MGSFTQLKPEFFPHAATGTVIREVSSQSTGRVKFDASYWTAKLVNPNCDAKLLPGQEVVVVGRLGNTLLVKACQGSFHLS